MDEDEDIWETDSSDIINSIHDEVLSHVCPEGLFCSKVFDYKFVQDMGSDEYFQMLKPIQDRISRRSAYARASIAGGYCRNFMLGVQTVTDIDIVTNDFALYKRHLLTDYSNTSDATSVVKFQLPNNTLHLTNGFAHEYDYGGIFQTFVDPYRFDFTINLGCLSLMDGKLYAPPITLYDIKHRILRLSNTVERTAVDTALLLRAIRFALKYNLRVHSSIINAINMLIFIQDKLGSSDDMATYHSIKHMNDETQELRDSFFSALKYLRYKDTAAFSSFENYFGYIKGRVDSHDTRTLGLESCRPRYF
jgi:hypothetical protein